MSDIRLQRFDHAAVQAAITQITRRLADLKTAAAPAAAASTSGGVRVLTAGGGTGEPGSIPNADGIIIALDQVLGLLGVLDGKADRLHQHTLDSVDGLQEALDTLMTAMASATVYGNVRLSVDPADPADAVAVGTNDPRLNAMSPIGKVHEQNIASTVWTIQHDLGFVPGVDVLDSAGSAMWPGLEHNHPSRPTITLLHFLAPVSGTARIS